MPDMVITEATASFDQEKGEELKLSISALMRCLDVFLEELTLLHLCEKIAAQQISRLQAEGRRHPRPGL